MYAHAHLAVAADQHQHTRITRLRSDPPLVLRPTLDTGTAMPGWQVTGAATVSLAASAAGPVGGDQLRLDVDVGTGTTLVLRTVAATLVLPGPHSQRSYTETTMRVAPDATLIWLPEPIIAARGCDHQAVTRIQLEPGARLLAREELILGRHRELPGTVRQRVRAAVGHRPLHDQELCIGVDEPGWRSPAVTGGRKALGSLLLVAFDTVISRQLMDTSDADTAILALSDSATLITALARDALMLRRGLDRYLPLNEAARSPTSP